MEIEDQIRELMRAFEVRCPSCSQDVGAVGRVREVDTDVGILDEMYCDECEIHFRQASSIQTYFVED